MNFETDLNVPAYSEPGYSLDTGFAYTVELFSTDYLYSDAKTRWGFMLGHQKLSTMRENVEDDPYPYTATSLQWERDWLVLKRSKLIVSAGIGVGAVFVSESEKQCNSPFCSLPNGSWLFTPFAQVSVPLFSAVSLVSTVRGTIYVDSREEMYPYQPGVIFSIGIGLNAKPDNKKHQPSGTKPRETG